MSRTYTRAAWWRLLLVFVMLSGTALACSQGANGVIYVTATPMRLTVVPGNDVPIPNQFIPTYTPIGPTATAIQPTPNPTTPPVNTTTQYTIQPGDTLQTLATDYGTDVRSIVALNPTLSETAIIHPGETLNIPGRPSQTTPNFKIVPDSELVNSPAVHNFDVEAYIKFQPGFIRVYSEDVLGRRMSGTEIVQFISTVTSVNPRLLLALLEYRGGWVTNPVPNSDAMDYPMGFKDPNVKGLFLQLTRATNHLNAAYYGWKQRGLTTLDFGDKKHLAYAPELNAGTVAVQYFLSGTAASRDVWQKDVSSSGFFTTYMAMFGDPFHNAIEPLIPPDLKQPTFTLPFAQNETWYFTAGPHGGWDAYFSGWAAVDFAPPKPADTLIQTQGLCYVSPDFARAVVRGLVVRSSDGMVVIDVDMDGDERTGWTVTYLHVAEQDRVKAGIIVEPGYPIGHPSCQGFDLNAPATHLHIARRYNGEWIVADCSACAPGVAAPPFVMSGFQVHGLPGQAYQGYLEKDGQIHRAEQGRDDPTNQISW